METRRDLSCAASLEFAAYLLANGYKIEEWNPEKNKISGIFDGQKWSLRIPIHFPLASKGQGFPDYLASLDLQEPKYFLILIQAGHSALAYFEGDNLLHHKVIKKYMVRGNGKAQIGYLQTRGKSKAGSRIRLANSVSFFEDINEKLREWDVEDEAERILVSCTAKMLPLWFQSRISPPFSKNDPRIAKVPFDLQRPDLEELLRINKQIMRGRWQGDHEIVDRFFAWRQEQMQSEIEED